MSQNSIIFTSVFPMAVFLSGKLGVTVDNVISRCVSNLPRPPVERIIMKFRFLIITQLYMYFAAI